jgi:peptidyl-prolyl cis-trans isomerase SurA
MGTFDHCNMIANGLETPMKKFSDVITARAAGTLCAIILGASVAAVGAPVPTAKAQSEVSIVVNNEAITSLELQRRAAFLRLQRAGGNVNETARTQLVNEALQMQEAQRLRAVVSDSDVDASLQRFADSNNLTQDQLRQVLNQAGVGVEHFRKYIRAQMTWPRVVNARFGAQAGGMSQQDLVARMLERGGDKPSTTEYVLQQVVFVVPEARRSAILAQRQREADQMRSRFSDCAASREFARSLRDVSVIDLGRIMQPQLPDDWRQQIEGTSAGRTTATRTTPRGVEFIAVCSAAQVSDDLAAEMVFRSEEAQSSDMQAKAGEYLEELRQRARINNR